MKQLVTKEIEIQINKHQILKQEECDYFIIENNLVTFYRKNGHAYLIMPKCIID